MKTLLIVLLTVAVCDAYSGSYSLSGPPKPEVGKLMPDYVLTNVTHYKSRSASLADFRGKWLILDLWSTGCAGCVKTFREASGFQKEFGDRMTWVLVGRNDLEVQADRKAIETMYEKLRVKQDLHLIAAYDSILDKRWEVPFVPYIYIVDPTGVLRYISSSSSINREKLQDLLDGKAPSFHNSLFDRKENGPDNWMRYDVPVYRSFLTKWNNEQPGSSYLNGFEKYQEKELGFLMTKASLFDLYNTAYFGQSYLKLQSDSLYAKNYPVPVLEVKDSSLFYSNWGDGTGMYNYNLFIPPAEVTTERLMGLMRDDLHRAFRFNASVEVRKMPVWRLVAGKDADKRLRSKGGEPYNSVFERAFAAGFTIRNMPIDYLYWALTSYQCGIQNAPLINATGIKNNIDVVIDADLTNMEDIRKSIQKYGLDLVRGEKEMKVLVIRD